MDAGPNERQPSNFVLFATALLCGAALVWAYRDREVRLSAAAADEAEFGAPATPPEVVWDPSWEAAAPASRSFVSTLPTVTLLPPVASSGVAVEPLGAPLLAAPLLAAPTLAAPATDPFEPAAPDAAPWLPDTDEYNTHGLGGEAFAPTLLAPDDLATDEQSVLVEQPTPAPEEIENPYFAPTGPRVAEAAQPATEPPAPAADITPLAPRDFYEDDLAAFAADIPRDELLTYTPAAGDISQRVAPEVQAAFALGRHGALYAARERFVDAMRVIALARDADGSTDRFSRALDEGLVALDEAQDFLPGGAVSKELTVAEVAASHQTPMLRNHRRAEWTLPQEAAALYYRFAEQKLAASVAGEQAGSMALYGLGKTYDRLAEVEKSPAERQLSLAMHRAALTAHNGNHMAANELGVGLAKVGRYDKAAVALQQSITSGGGSTVYRNLAHVQHKLGQNRLAAETSQQAERLAMAERTDGAFSREQGVQWVAPDQLARQSSPAGAPPQPAVASLPSPQQPAAEQPSSSPLGGVKRFARRIWVGSPDTATAPPTPVPAAQGPAPQAPTNRTATPVRSQTTFR
ncbi:hypothetical protein Pla123a_35890 [Posidoniimonas polymericola]|uniref:Tetratricopeptide repeat protein n=1 Tax=Posidoniimonas polymericola TaxID=2528002 RepID=A0A5C5YDA9_9BACT|nr:hypothetical protein [Posidoniimonas polymericola]TWT73696.1 hypothetical protein Pla123a_35890 [Posidoniimonas polymericola]